MSKYTDLMLDQMMQGVASPASGGIPPAPMNAAPVAKGIPPAPVTPPADQANLSGLRTDDPGVGMSAAQGVLMGGADELWGLVGAVLPGEENTYEKYRDSARREHERERAMNPMGSMAAELGGAVFTGIATAGLGSAALAARGVTMGLTAASKGQKIAAYATGAKQAYHGKGLAGIAGTSGITGGIQGAGVGVMTGDDPLASVDTFRNALMGSAGGAFMGTAGTYALSKVNSLAPWAAQNSPMKMAAKARRDAKAEGKPFWERRKIGKQVKREVKLFRSRFMQDQTNALLEEYKLRYNLPPDAKLKEVHEAARREGEKFVDPNNMATQAEREQATSVIPAHLLGTDASIAFYHTVMRNAIDEGDKGMVTLLHAQMKELQDLDQTLGRRALGWMTATGKRFSEGNMKSGKMNVLKEKRRRDPVTGATVNEPVQTGQVFDFASPQAYMNNISTALTRHWKDNLAGTRTRLLGSLGHRLGGINATATQRIDGVRTQIAAGMSSVDLTNGANLLKWSDASRKMVSDALFPDVDASRLRLNPLDSRQGADAFDRFMGESTKATDLGLSVHQIETLRNGAMNWGALSPDAKAFLTRAHHLDDFGKQAGLDTAQVGKLYAKFASGRADEQMPLGEVESVRLWDTLKRDVNESIDPRSDGSTITAGQLKGLRGAIDTWILDGQQRRMVMAQTGAESHGEVMWTAANRMYSDLQAIDDMYRWGAEGGRVSNGRPYAQGDAIAELDALRANAVSRIPRGGQPGQYSETLADRGMANVKLLAARAGLLQRLKDGFTAQAGERGDKLGSTLEMLHQSIDSTELLKRTVRVGTKENHEPWALMIEHLAELLPRVNKAYKSMEGIELQRKDPGFGRMMGNALAEMAQTTQDAVHGYAQFYYGKKALDDITNYAKGRQSVGVAKILATSLSQGVDEHFRILHKAAVNGQILVVGDMGDTLRSTLGAIGRGIRFSNQEREPSSPYVDSRFYR